MTQLYTQTTIEERPEVDLDWLSETANTLVGNVMRHMRMDGAERSIYRDDLHQEALTQLYDLKCLQGYNNSYAYVAARTRLIGYVFVNIRGGGHGHQWELSKQYKTLDNLAEADEHKDPDSPHSQTRLPMSIYARRPTEDTLLLKEAKDENEALWEQFEREIARILAVMRGSQWHPNSLRRAAKALCESVKGTSNYNIAQLLNLEWLTATQIIIHYRPYIEAFLALSPIMQGMVRAEGELRLCWWDEVTEAVLNSGQRFIVIMPHGAFTVGYYNSKSKGKQLCRIQIGRRIHGKVVNRSVQVGEVGRLTLDKLWQDSHRVQQKLAELEALV